MRKFGILWAKAAVTASRAVIYAAGGSDWRAAIAGAASAFADDLRRIASA